MNAMGSLIKLLQKIPIICHQISLCPQAFRVFVCVTKKIRIRSQAFIAFPMLQKAGGLKIEFFE